MDADALLQLEFTGGLFAAVTVSAHAAYRSLVEVTGSDGILTAENGMSVDHPVDVVHRRGGAVVETTTVDNADGYTRMLDSFADAHSGGDPFLATGRDGLRNMRVLDAAYRSWRSGGRETV